jgi:hypothetical protein
MPTGQPMHDTLPSERDTESLILDLLDELICRCNEAMPGTERAAFGDLPERINALAADMGLDPGPGLEVHDRHVRIYDPVQRRGCEIAVDWRAGFAYDHEVRLILPLLRWRRLIASGGTPAATCLTSMSAAQGAVWEALRGLHRTAAEIAGACGLPQDDVRQAIRDLRAIGREVRHRGGRGYWRPDAPPV